MHARGACVLGGMHAGECVCPGGVYGEGDMHGEGGMCGKRGGGMHSEKDGMHSEGACVVKGGGVRSRRGGHCSERYASYWNAFFLFFKFTACNLCRSKLSSSQKVVIPSHPKTNKNISLPAFNRIIKKSIRYLTSGSKEYLFYMTTGVGRLAVRRFKFTASLRKV